MLLRNLAQFVEILDLNVGTHFCNIQCQTTSRALSSHIMQKYPQSSVSKSRSNDRIKRTTFEQNSSRYCSCSATEKQLTVGAVWQYYSTVQVYDCSGNLRGNLMHDLSGGVFQCVLQVVLEVAEELPGPSLHHVQQSSAIIGIHIWGQRTLSQSESRGTQTQCIYRGTQKNSCCCRWYIYLWSIDMMPIE